MDVVTIALILVLVSIIAEVWRSWSGKSNALDKAKLPPVVEKHYSPIWGHLSFFSKIDRKTGRALVEIEELVKTSPARIVALYPGPPFLVAPLYVIKGEEEGKWVANKTDLGVDVQQAAVMLIGGGIISSKYLLSEAQYKKRRKVFATALLRPKRLTHLGDVAVDVARSRLFVDYFNSKCHSSTTGSYVETGFGDILGTAAMAIIMEHVMGEELVKKLVLDKDAEMRRCFELGQRMILEFSRLLQAGLPLGLYPYLHPINFREGCRATSDLRKSYVMPFVEQRLRDIRDGKDVPDDPLTLVLGSDDDEEESASNMTLSAKEAADDIVGFLIPGETINNTLQWVLVHLALNPDLQQKCYEEITSVIGSIPEEGRPSYEDLEKMLYWNAFIKETQRLSPVVHGIGRSVTQTVKIRDYVLPAGSWTLIPFSLAQLSDKNYANAEKIVPERWLEDPVSGGAPEGRKTLTYAPFGHGPHRCFGQQIALTAMRLLGACLLQSFRLEMVSPVKEPRPVVEALTFVPEDLAIRVVQRNTN